MWGRRSRGRRGCVEGRRISLFLPPGGPPTIQTKRREGAPQLILCVCVCWHPCYIYVSLWVHTICMVMQICSSELQPFAAPPAHFVCFSWAAEAERHNVRASSQFAATFYRQNPFQSMLTLLASSSFLWMNMGHNVETSRNFPSTWCPAENDLNFILRSRHFFILLQEWFYTWCWAPASLALA